MSDGIKVTVAAVVGTTPPAWLWFSLNVEPILKVSLIVGQLAVAIVTVLYIYRKWRNAKKKNLPSDD